MNRVLVVLLCFVAGYYVADLLGMDVTRPQSGKPWHHVVGPYSTEDCDTSNIFDNGNRGCQYYTTLLALHWVEEESRDDWVEFADVLHQVLQPHPMLINSATGEGITAAKTRLRKDLARDLHPFYALWDSTQGYPDWPDTAALAMRLLQGL